MKIAKVNHIKTGISSDSVDQNGFMYKNPTEGQRSTDIEKHVRQRVKEAERFKEKFKYYVPENASPEEKKKGLERKEKFINDVKKSIENQNMLVQPIEIGDEDMKDMMIGLSLIKGELGSKNGGENVLSRKAREKAAFRRFLLTYADLDENKRMDYLRKLRRIIILYFYGADALNQDTCEEFNVWVDHKERQNDNSNYIVHSFPNLDAFDSKDAKKKEDDDYKKLAEIIRNTNIASYSFAREYIESQSTSENGSLFFSDNDLNVFWIHHIENEVERVYAKTRRINRNNTYKLCKGYISEKVWKGVINYICIKYIAVGKVVYNMAMEGINSDGNENLGVLADSFSNGISSFDYELIKAEERLQRETAVYVTFAINNFLTATSPRNNADDDIGSKGGKKIELLPETKRSILQFFGGRSIWSEFDFEKYSSEDSGKYLWQQICSILSAMRNESFHFKTNNYSSDWNQSLIIDIFKYDSAKCSRTEIKRIYSNNIPKFYKDADIVKLLHSLYNSYNQRATQVPAFNSVFVRKNFPEVVKNKLRIILNEASVKEQEMFHSALYYLLKEIYYNAFLCDSRSKDLFLGSVKNKSAAEKKDIEPTRDFKKRIDEITRSGNYSLSEICQIIMTEYNQQNDKWMKKRTNKGKEKRPDGYQHYKMILLDVLRDTFLAYLNLENEKFGFIKKPIVKTEVKSIEDYLPDFRTDRYDSILERFEDDVELQKWYIVGRFLYPKQVNYLAGCFRNYLQYSWDIERRAHETGNDVNISSDMQDRILRILQIIDICTTLNGNVTNNLTDYFDDEDEYATYVGRFLDFDSEMAGYSISPSGKLKEFCNSYAKGENDNDSRIGVYYDGKKPIVNRNIILSKLYGNGELLSDALSDNKVKLDEIQEYFKFSDKISDYRVRGNYKNKEEVIDIKKYQEIKNHIEFRDVVEYSEILNELQGQLINYTFLRERDLLYYQLGFHYTCLKNDSYKPEDYKKIVVDNKTINNAILHQIVSLYINGVHLYVIDEHGHYYANKDKSAGGNITEFFDYCKKCFTEFKSSLTVYSAGLELFENIDEHEEIIKLRNYIDHFKYFINVDSVNKGRSMIDLYSEIFDRFFTYDLKYHKNVPNVLYNILMGHFVAMSIDFATGTKKVNKKNKERASLRISKVVAEPFTYKLSNEKVECPARSERFLRNVIKILYYRETTVPDIIYREGMVKSLSNDKKGNNQPNKKKNNNKKNNNGKMASSELTSNPFDELFSQIDL